jgi:4-amino-4-deoxy-L-arabinose transferase-like glycosyltransferase
VIAPIHQNNAEIQLPPTGWGLVSLLAFYVLAGLFGHDPWRGEDAVHLAAAFDIVQENDWLSPDLAGIPFNEPPLYYWSAAILGKLLGWFIPMHDAMRLASGVWVALALTGSYYAAREAFGQDSAAAAPLLLAGSLGLVFHAHHAQPMLVGLAAIAGALGALEAWPRRPKLAAVFYCISITAALLGIGWVPSLPILAFGPLALVLRRMSISHLLGLLAAYVVSGLVFCFWLWMLWRNAPERLADTLQKQNQIWLSSSQPLLSLGSNLSMLLWFAWPSLPVAMWTVWRLRRRMAERHALTMPCVAFVTTLIVISLSYQDREVPGILLLPSLALLGTPGILNLRRGATQALDWLSRMTFSIFVLLVWLGWSAMVFGWPESLAKRAVELEPGFVGTLSVPWTLLALVVTVFWLWLVSTSPRSNYRSLAHWTAGLTTFWLLLATLWLPWIDYGNSYRDVASRLTKQLGKKPGCVAVANLGDTQRASFAYFAGLQLLPAHKLSASDCKWLLIQGRLDEEPLPFSDGWRKVWEGHRQKPRKEMFFLYARQNS